MTTPMIERVAGVIFREFGDRTHGTNPADDYKSMKVAALVLAAMREPSEAIIKIAYGDEHRRLSFWREAIDAALNEREQG